jgi:hypothetical protein
MRRIIKGFECELVPNDDRPGVNCFVTKDNACNSLAVLQDLGEFDEPNALGNPIRISQAALDEIERWALANGY